MSKRSTRDKLNNAVNAGSMADIAFLLLIFFLVTTTIDNDKGILVKLPPYEESLVSTTVAKRNVFKILVNERNEILGRNQLLSAEHIKDKIKEFISNPQHSDKFARSPQKAIVSLQTDRGTKYGTYISVYNELKAAYHELRDEMSLKRYGKLFDKEALSIEQYNFIKGEIPLILSEAEPVAFTE